MLEVNHSQLERLVKEYYEKKWALFCYGTYGIGKSDSIRRSSKEIAEDKGKEYLEWNELSYEKKDEIEGNPEDYFVLVDRRLAQDDPTDLKGIPQMNGDKATEWKAPRWIYFMSLEGSDGMCYLDEMNLAPKNVQGASYQLIFDRQISDYSISDNWGFISAGNLKSDRSFVKELSSALKDRYGECKLTVPHYKDWIEWGLENKIDDRILAYIPFNPSHLHQVNEEIKGKNSTPRGWERASDLIRGITTFTQLELLVGSAVGEGIAKEFISFLKLRKDFDYEDILDNPKTGELPSREEDLSLLYPFISGIVERYRANKCEEMLGKTFTIANRLDPEFGILLMRLVRQVSPNYFNNKKTSTECKSEWNNFKGEWKKYLI